MYLVKANYILALLTDKIADRVLYTWLASLVQICSITLIHKEHHTTERFEHRVRSDPD